MATLTQRRRPQTTPSSGASNDSAGFYGDSATNKDSAESTHSDDERDRDDDKETRLTLMEEVLLLGLKDREVKEKNSSLTLKTIEC